RPDADGTVGAGVRARRLDRDGISMAPPPQTRLTLPLVEVRTRAKWRQWLAQHHASTPGIWVVRHKPTRGVASMPYEDVVCEALCFGWIDSLVKRLDENRYAIKVTPRKPTSNWSDLNRKRWKALQAAGLLAAPGIAAAPTANRYAAKPTI